MQETTKQQMETVEHRVQGPPGCGKTTWLGSRVEEHAYGGNRVMVLSLTKAAAAEIGGRGLPIPYDALGTLHSHCYHAIGSPEIAESQEHIQGWNEDQGESKYHMSLGKNDLGERIDGDNLEPIRGDMIGDQLMAEYQILRARMVPLEQMPSRIQQFATEWEEWKKGNGMLDFTDLINICLQDVVSAPGNPDVIFVDEAQDMDLLEMSLIRKWGGKAGTLFIVGDPDQAIYEWRGADPSAFTANDIPLENQQVLAQSYRVPVAVHAHAVKWIERITGRTPVEYRPRDHEGELRQVNANWMNPGPAVTDAERYLADGKNVMFLTTCSYMLQDLVALLRSEGIPFHNPYRRRNGAWNPLQKRRGTISTADRVAAFLRLRENGGWSAQDLNDWTQMTKIKGVLQANGRKNVKALQNAEDGWVDWTDIYSVLTNEAVEQAMKGNLEWFEENLTSARQTPARYPLAIARNQGIEHLMSVPRLTVGTIHSVKGAESDVVYLFPDISRAGMAEWTGNEAQKASVYRLFYVGMTRARETLAICQPADDRCVDLAMRSQR